MASQALHPTPTAKDEEVELEHLAFRREVDEHLAWGQAEHFCQGVLNPLTLTGVLAQPPGERDSLKIGRRKLERPLREPPVSKGRDPAGRDPLGHRVCGGSRSGAAADLVQEFLVGRTDQILGLKETRPDRFTDDPPIERCRTPNRMVPVDVSKHLHLGEQERLERTHRLFSDADLEPPVVWILENHEPLKEPIHIDLPIRDPAEPRVPAEIVHLVQIEAPADEPTKGMVRFSTDEPVNRFRGPRPEGNERVRELGRVEEAPTDRLVITREPASLEFLHGVGKGVVPDVVEKRGVGDLFRTPLHDLGERALLAEESNGRDRKMIDPERVIESGVGRPRVDEVGEPELANVPKSLIGGRVHNPHGNGIEANRVPEGVPDDLEGAGGGVRGHETSLPLPLRRSNGKTGLCADARTARAPCLPFHSPHTFRGMRDHPSVKTLGTLRDRVRTGARDVPGVYRFLGPRGETLYVGKSIRVRTRLLSHLRTRSGKGVELLRVTHGVDWEEVGGELEALLLEFRWIRALRPRFNLVHRRDRRYAWVRLTGERAPRLIPVRGDPPPLARGERLFGPFPATRSLPKTLRDLARACGVRDCAGPTPMRFRDQMALFTPDVPGFDPPPPLCPRGSFGTCPAPCVGGCSEDGYRERVREAAEFLEGRTAAPLERLETRMRAAAERESFETAGRIRDRADRLQRLQQSLVDTRAALESLSLAYPAPGRPDREARRWMLFREGRLLRVLAEPAHDDPVGGLELTRQWIAAVREPPIPWGAATHDDREARFVVARWFREHPEARAEGAPLTETPPPAFTGSAARVPE
jgi:excinuclease ABC subunit C